MKYVYRNLKWAVSIFCSVGLVIFLAYHFLFLGYLISDFYPPFGYLLFYTAVIFSVGAVCVILVNLPGFLILLFRSRSDRTPMKIMIGLIGCSIIFLFGFLIFSIFSMSLAARP